MDGSLFPELHEATGSQNLTKPLIIDSFAGGGGASLGIEMALGRSPDIAINHDEVALTMHEANHPTTRHIQSSVYAVDPRDLVEPGQRVGLLWASPDCTHHSKAKGGKPLKKNIRDLAWVVVHYAELIKPEIIILENVEEFLDWCPLTDAGKPDPDRKGETFQRWKKRLVREGYRVEHRILRGCDYDAPTIRKRLFVIARRDGLPIVWPAPTRAPKTSALVKHRLCKPWLTAADIIDWSIPCPSIFDTTEEIKSKFGVRAIRPLADNTLKRIARGVQKYVIEAEEPFVVTYAQHGGGLRSGSDPLQTITASLKDQNAIVVPTMVQTGYGERQGQAPRCLDLHSPLGTMMATGSKHALVAPALVNIANSKTTGRGPNAWQIREPVRTITSSSGFALVAPSLISVNHGYSGGRREYPLDDPINTMCASNGLGLVSPVLAAFYGEGQGGTNRCAHMGDPDSTVTTANRHALVSAFLAQHNGGPNNNGLTGRSAGTPLSTITTRGTQQQIVAASMVNLRGTGDGHLRGVSVESPVGTISAGGNHCGLVAAFMAK